MDPELCAEPRRPGEQAIAEMKRECGYDEMDEVGGVDALIDYKNALEERLVALIDEAAERRGAP